MVNHHTSLPAGNRSWLVDPAAAATLAAWVQRQPQLFESDLAGMQTYFPHWILAGATAQAMVLCSECRTPVVPTAGAMRCLDCHQPAQASHLHWFGHVPVLARPEHAFQQAMQRLQAAGFGQIQVDHATYMLVPLSVWYPSHWPNQPPTVRYNQRWLATIGLPASNASYHLVGNGSACIYGYNDWVAQPIHQVLGQRMLNHALSLCKIIAGQSARQAFIGRVAH